MGANRPRWINFGDLFFRQGFIDTRTLPKQGVTTKKYYERISKLQIEGEQPTDNDEELGRK